MRNLSLGRNYRFFHEQDSLNLHGVSLRPLGRQTDSLPLGLFFRPFLIEQYFSGCRRCGKQEETRHACRIASCLLWNMLLRLPSKPFSPLLQLGPGAAVSQFPPCLQCFYWVKFVSQRLQEENLNKHGEKFKLKYFRLEVFYS